MKHGVRVAGMLRPRNNPFTRYLHRAGAFQLLRRNAVSGEFRQVADKLSTTLSRANRAGILPATRCSAFATDKQSYE